MLTKVFFVVSLFSLCLYFYGILVTITVSEKNVCNMTYMFEYPQYVVSSLNSGSIICLRNDRDKVGNLELMHHYNFIGIAGHVILLPKNDE